MAVKTTKVQCNQDVDLRGKVDVEGKVTCGGDAEVDGDLTINSASNLKTKDGTSLGEIDVFELTYSRFVGEETPTATLTDDEISKLKTCDLLRIKDSDSIYTFSNLMGTYFADTAILSAELSISCYCILDEDSKTLILHLNQIETVSKKTLDDFTNVVVKLVNDKQSTLYRHTIDIAAGGLGLHTYVMALSEKNTVIDSIQDLVAVFGNTKLMATGQHSADSKMSALLEVGTSLTNTYVWDGAGNETSLSNWASTGPDETYLEITDTVTAM